MSFRDTIKEKIIKDRVSTTRIPPYIKDLEDFIEQVLQSVIFEPNNALTRWSVNQQISSYLYALVLTKCINIGYNVVCNDTNNSNFSNELHVKVLFQDKATSVWYTRNGSITS